ncbi:ABC transporter substrate-binding protein [Plantibacter sp. PA-3-X8]|nr:ABC transporter substrate-binding protein [Plantibacter sp. CFBP 8804]AZH83378.1 ABC transporter substrate-binding protein [Plantibacter sp. PA-3-X8]MBD8516080.1 ABC transporter substrate-binding protein [Plantibacter sp. CFBP 8804]
MRCFRLPFPQGGTVKFSRFGSAAAIIAAGALVLTGCSGGGSSSESTSSASSVITTNGSEPESGLIPSDTNEVGGGKIIDEVFAGLRYYAADGKPVDDLAESIDTDDSTTFTIKIKADQKFTNGDPVTADSFVMAWQDAVVNLRKNASFFADVEGYNETGQPLTGLSVVDDTTFTVKLSAPASDFPLRLGYSAFYPLPAAAFDAAGKVTDEFGQNPIGNGPYKVDGDKAWKHNESIKLVKNDEYKGGREAKNGGLTITFYKDFDSAYADLLSGNLDVLDQIPDSALSTYQDDLGDRAVNQPAAVFQSFTIPSRLPHFSGEEGQLRRQAISYAINREEITKVIFNGTRTPATDFTSPVIDGYSKDIEGNDVLKYNEKKAKELWAEADAISPWDGSFQIAYNADGPHQAWVDAVTNGIKNVLGIESSGVPVAVFGDFRAGITNRSIETAFRSGWQADYPGLYNFLAPLYATGASSNDGDYSSPEFDKLLSEGSSETDLDAANKKFQDAQAVLFKDLPAIPLWYQNVSGGFGEGVQNVEFGWNSVPLYYEITK